MRHTLSNGIEVRTIEHRAAPVITFVLQVEGGSGADPASQEGLAAITADMVDEGTGSLSAIDVSDAITRIGADYDVDVGSDVTTFTLTTLERFSARGAQLLADLLIRPSLRETDFQRVRQLRLDRLRQLKDVAPAVAERAFLRLLYGEHPYGHLSIGHDTALRALSIADVSAFHAERFVPAQAIIVIAGDMTHDAMRARADASFGSWVNWAEPVARRRASEIEPVGSLNGQLAIVPREGAAQSELRIGHLSAKRNTPDYSALLVMNSVLGGQFVSRVNLKLREEKGYTYGARTGFDWRRGLAPFSLSTERPHGSDGGSDQGRPCRDRRASRHPARDGQRTGPGQGIADPWLSAELRNRGPGGPGSWSACTLRPPGYVFSRVHA